MDRKIAFLLSRKYGVFVKPEAIRSLNGRLLLNREFLVLLQVLRKGAEIIDPLMGLVQISQARDRVTVEFEQFKLVFDTYKREVEVVTK